HVVQVVYEAGGYLKTGHNVTDTYNLSQFHFHVPSEHTVDGKSFDGELHLNHVNLLGEQVIVTVFLTQKDNAHSNVFDDIVAKAPATVGVSAATSVKVNAEDLLPKDTSEYYSYDGSGS